VRHFCRRHDGQFDTEIQDTMTMPNQVTGANSRPASPLEAGQELGSASCAPPSPSAAVAQF
jgi:hypothetical protein